MADNIWGYFAIWVKFLHVHKEFFFRKKYKVTLNKIFVDGGKILY